MQSRKRITSSGVKGFWFILKFQHAEWRILIGKSHKVVCQLRHFVLRRPSAPASSASASSSPAPPSPSPSPHEHCLGLGHQLIEVWVTVDAALLAQPLFGQFALTFLVLNLNKKY